MSCVRVGTAMKAYRLKDLLRSWQTVQQSIAALGARQEFPVARSGSRLASTFAAPNGIAVGLRGLSATRSASDLVVEKHAALGRLAIGPAGSRLFSADGALHKDEESEKKPQDLGSKLEAGKVAGVTSYWGITPRTYLREDGTPWPWKDFQPEDSYVPDTTVDLSKHHKPQNWSDRLAYWTVKSLRVPTDIFFRKRYGCRAMMLETVAAVPGMVAGMLLHFKSLRRFERSGGWIKALLDEAENERMHLMTFMEVAQPKWYERALVLAVQGIFFNAYFLFYILSPRVAHRIVGYLEEEAIYSYTQFLKEIDNGHIENVPAPAIAIDYWKLPEDASLRDVVVVVRADEAHHRDVNHFASDVQKEGKDLKDVPAPIGYH